MKTLRLWLGLGLLGVAFLDVNPLDYIPDVIPNTPVLVIDKPSDSLINLTKPAADKIRKSEDRIEMAIFMYEASKRLDKPEYRDITGQNVDTLLVTAGKEYLDVPVSVDNPGFSGELQSLIETVIGNKDVYLEDKAADLSDAFESLAWNLIQ